MNRTSDEYSYWLYGWLESNRVTTVERAGTLLTKRASFHDLRKVAEQWSTSSAVRPPSGVNLAAGTGLRLDDLLICPNPACRRQQVDVLFRHAWHYFDRVLLPDGVGDLLLHPPEGWTHEYLLRVIVDRIALVLHIRDLGASGLVYFYPKIETTEEAASILDPGQMTAWGEAWREIEDKLVSEGVYSFKRTARRRYAVKYVDPLLNVGGTFRFTLSKSQSDDEKTVREIVAHQVMHEHMSCLEEDLRVRRMLVAPLGANVWSHERVLSRISGAPATADIAFRLSLPSLAHVPIRELVAVRRGEGASFAAFRSALTKAIREYMGQKTSASPEQTAADIARDIIEPELTRLEQRLRVAQQALSRKTAVFLAIAGLATTCGLLVGAGPVVAGVAGVGALMSGVGTGASKYLDEKQAIELSDMYFVWKALAHAE